MEIVTRKQLGWGASRAPKAPCDQGFVLHYDGSNRNLANRPHSACVSYMHWCDNFHRESNGWTHGFGYSFAVCPHGIVFEGRGFGREQAAQKGGNRDYTSCTLMCGPGDTITVQQIASVNELYAWLVDKGVKSELRGHRDIVSSSCPGAAIYDMIQRGVFKPRRKDGTLALDKDDKAWLREMVRTELASKHFRDTFWNADECPAPIPDDKNPEWQYKNVLRFGALASKESADRTKTLVEMVEELARKIDAATQ